MTDKLRWTKEFPSEPGWYWAHRAVESDPVVVFVNQVAGGGPLCVIQNYLGDDGAYYGGLDRFARWWAGPISLPENARIPRVQAGVRR